MPLRRSLLLAALALPLFIAGCKIETINYFPPKFAQVRFANYIADTAGLDFLVDKVALWTAVSPEAITAYSDLDPVQHTFGMRVTGTTNVVAESQYSLDGEVRYTLFALGTMASPTTLFVADAKTGPGSGTFRARALNLAPNVASFDMYLTAPDADITNLSPNAKTTALVYGTAGLVDNYPSGAARIRVTPAGTKTVIYDSGTITLPGDTNANLVVYSRGSGMLVNLALLETTGAATSTTLNSNAARVRALNLANDSGTLNLLANQALLFPGLDYGTPAAYAGVANGAYDFTVEAASTPGATLATLGRTLVPATDTTLYVKGNPGSNSIVALDDNNTPSLAGAGRLRIANVTGDGATIDVLAGTTVIASALSPTATPAYLDLAVGTYTLTARNTATGATLATLGGYAAAIGTVHTLYVAGSATQATMTLTQDR